MNGAKDIKGVLESQSKIGFRDLYTGDESWIFTINIPKAMRMSLEEPVQTKPRATIQAEKRKLTFFWGVDGFKVVNWLPIDQNMNSRYFIANILEVLSKKTQNESHRQHKPFTLLHMDNFKIHTSKLVSSQLNDLRLKKTFHPPYSPDLALSEFFLFGYMKDLLAKAQYSNFEEVEEKVDEILNRISRVLITSVFHDWIERCRKVIDSNGDYI